MADTPQDLYRAVLEAMHRAGCAPTDPKVIVFDGQLHRFQVEGDRRGSRNGWLVLYDDGIPAGAFGSWRTGQPHTWRAEDLKTLTPEQRRREEQRIAEARVRRQEALQALHEQARVRAGELWARARPQVDVHHPYLLKKQVTAIGLRQLKELLVAPVRDGAGDVHSLAFINPQGEKQFLKDSVVEGHYHHLGDLPGARALLLCEGYATGASLHQASGLPVIVCFNRVNLLPVAKDVHRRYPQTALVIAGDDDRYTLGNPGRSNAEEAAKWVGGSMILPDFTGLDTHTQPTDFNDLHVLGGLPRLKAALDSQLAVVLPVRPPPTPENDVRPTVPGRRAGGSFLEEAAEPEGESHRAPIPVMAMAAPARRKAQSGRPRRNLYQEVTDQIIEMIEAGTAPWQRCWDRPHYPGAPASPINAVTGQPYHGINVLLLRKDPLMAGDPRWCGYEQAKSRGWQVKAGAHGTPIYFYKRIEVDPGGRDEQEPLPAEGDSPPERTTLPLLRRHTVFHASQIEGIPSMEDRYGPADPLVDYDWQQEQHLEALLRRTGARIIHEGHSAYFESGEDRIVLPPRERFSTAADYYVSAFHELAHWTGHPARLNRPQAVRRDSPVYAREELRAELASAFLGAELGLTQPVENHAAYIDQYLDLLRQDHREIFRAARDAQGIADLILDRHPTLRLDHGVCMPRAEPLPEGALLPAAAVDSQPIREAPAAGVLETEVGTASADGRDNREEGIPIEIHSESDRLLEPAPVLATPFGWAAAALRELETSVEDGGALGRLAHRIDAALPLLPAPVAHETPAATPARDTVAMYAGVGACGPGH